MRRWSKIPLTLSASKLPVFPVLYSIEFSSWQIWNRCRALFMWTLYFYYLRLSMSHGIHPRPRLYEVVHWANKAKLLAVIYLSIDRLLVICRIVESTAVSTATNLLVLSLNERYTTWSYIPLQRRYFLQLGLICWNLIVSRSMYLKVTSKKSMLHKEQCFR